jgi:transglutaminase-like putative cysteine protease
MMRVLTRTARTDPRIRELAISLTNGLPQDDTRGQIERLFTFVRDSIRYVGDVNEVETLQPPADTLRLGAGDCDDKSMLLAALLESLGHRSRFAALAFFPDNFEHVLVETEIGYNGHGGKVWLPLETTPVNGAMQESGWYPEGVISKMVRHV